MDCRRYNRKRSSVRCASSGQTIVFLLMALTILMFALLWNIDLHRLVAGKTHAQNAGDAAALSAARWQGESLNLVGELNLMHALALSANDQSMADATTSMQARICFTGPLAGLVAAQIAAKNNRVYNDDDFTSLLYEHAREVRRYDEPVGGQLLFPEPFPGAWNEYAGMLEAIAADGIAAAPDNALFFGDATSGHILLDKDFYEAVAGRQWCWFYLNTATSSEPPRTLLDDFSSYESFGPLPPPNPPRYENSEIFGLGLTSRPITLRRIGGVEEAMLEAAESEGIDMSGYVSTNVLPRLENWYFFSSSVWDSPWPGMDPDGPDALPLAGPVKDEYNYTGADAVVRLFVTTYRMTAADAEDELVWTAAAKPFGYLADSGSSTLLQPHAYGLVLPAFRDIRLIPIDAATSGGDGSFDIDWRHHTDEHVPVYLECGRLDDGCHYCKLIKRFEDPAFRMEGVLWLRENYKLCVLPPKGGGGRGGGTRRGH